MVQARNGSCAVVDLEALERLRAFGGLVLLAQIVELFCDAVPERLEAVERAVVSHDPVEVRRAAHALRNSADNVGAASVVALAADIEACADTRVGLEDLGALVRDLRHECEAARSRLRIVAADLTSVWA